ncbi:hypothetical protein H920_02732 [Fukomys damarensis]|uniref:Uncharacterized protein n=1 Tax=Fukomys damarensis TaxID=885580 RepID=A0A091DZZ4_FUKDA|nr:hypothetical protein H920_02732 [Fukomys damarensis]
MREEYAPGTNLEGPPRAGRQRPWGRDSAADVMTCVLTTSAKSTKGALLSPRQKLGPFRQGDIAAHGDATRMLRKQMPRPPLPSSPLSLRGHRARKPLGANHTVTEQIPPEATRERGLDEWLLERRPWKDTAESEDVKRRDLNKQFVTGRVGLNATGAALRPPGTRPRVAVPEENGTEVVALPPPLAPVRGQL